MHGILGALLLMPCAWFLALFLVREGIKAQHREPARSSTTRAWPQAKRQVAEQLRANGMPLPPALEEALKAPMALPPARE